MILFGLFGYPLRNINLNQIVNSINKKDCIVEIEFSTRGHRYLIRRGLAPNCFVIFKDGEEIIQEAKTKDYQNMLEEKVLQVDYETFRQVVVLGSASYVPFMRLKSTERKEIIEDLLNIKIFSEMAAILKTKFTNLKSEIERTDSELVAITQKITMQEGYCQEAKKRKNIQTSSIDEQITEHQKTLTATIKESEECSARISELTDQIADQTYTANIKEMETLKIKLESTQERIKRDVNFIKNSDVCPTCTQKILDDFKTEFVAIREPKITQRDQAIKDIVEKIENLEAKQKEIDDYKNQLSEARSNLLGLNGKIKYISGTIGRLTEQKVKALEAQSTSDDKIEMALADFRSEKDQLETTKRGQQETRYLYEMATAMLKETGVKSKILEQYLPILNNTINHYLNRMEFLVDFNINGNFEETIKSRFRDEFSYESFSEGEKARINLALLLTWRAIATMKNSILSLIHISEPTRPY